MSYNDKTVNYKLPQWRSDDKPSRQDYNEAFATVDSALANKVNIYGEVVTPEQYSDFDQFPFGHIRAYGVFKNGPYGRESFNGEVFTREYHGYMVQNAVNIGTGVGATYQRQWGSGKWLPWVRMATAEPQQQYDIIAASGFSGGGKFWKSQFGEVTFNILISGSNFAVGQTLVVLPVGFRPSVLLEVPYVSTSGALGMGTVYVNTDGTIKITVAPPIGATYLSIPTTSFIAS